MRKFNKITIVGVGLMGGSIGLALKNKRLARHIVGVGHHKSSIKRALRLKTADEGTLDIRRAVSGADIVIMSTPILSMAGLTRKMSPYLKKGCIVTDVGSTKLRLAKEMERLLPQGIYYVGGHPMAGSEKKGVEKARKDLFKDSVCILTKTKNTGEKPVKTVKNLWRALGAEVIVMSPRDHDRIISEVSHLPHMLIFSLLNSIDPKGLRFASSGFYDTTRIASSDAIIWKDIAITNKEEILKSISRFKKSLSILQRGIDREDGATLMKVFKIAKKRRELLK